MTNNNQLFYQHSISSLHPQTIETAVDNPTHHICKRFQQDRHRIDVLLKKDPEFLALCEDYEACVKALQYWVKSKEAEAEARIIEYHDLIQDLQEEISEALKSLKSPQLK